jgi:hypothetical protein
VPTNFLSKQKQNKKEKKKAAYSRMILASTVLAPLAYAITGFKSNSLISG